MEFPGGGLSPAGDSFIMCESCKQKYGSLFLSGDQWLCKHCYYRSPDSLPYFKEVGVENPYDKQGSTAHVRDIKNRRLDTKTNKMFYHEPPKTYFFPKG